LNLLHPRLVTLGPDYRRLWSASALSNLADGVFQVALPLLALRITRSPGGRCRSAPASAGCWPKPSGCAPSSPSPPWPSSRWSAAPPLLAAATFALTRPIAFGGAEIDPITMFQVVDELPRHDSAAAWIVAVSLMGNVFLTFYPDEGVEEIYGSPGLVMSGAAH